MTAPRSVEEKVVTVDVKRENTARGSWESPEQGGKVAD